MAEKTLEELLEAMTKAGKEYWVATDAQFETAKARLLAATRAYYDAKAKAEKKAEEK